MPMSLKVFQLLEDSNRIILEYAKDKPAEWVYIGMLLRVLCF